MSTYETRAKSTKENIVVNLKCENKNDLEITPPPEFGGPEDYWSPEDLFSASISTCYILTFKVLAQARKKEWDSIDVKVEAELEKTNTGFRFTHVNIQPTLEISNIEEQEDYIKLLERAKSACLVTNSMNCEFEVNATIINH